jgi:hypothetical protein
LLAAPAVQVVAAMVDKIPMVLQALLIQVVVAAAPVVIVLVHQVLVAPVLSSSRSPILITLVFLQVLLIP